MVLLYLIERLLIGLIMISVVTQILIPLLTDRPLFPVLRKGNLKAQSDLSRVLEEEETAKLEAEIQKHLKRIEEIRNNTAKKES